MYIYTSAPIWPQTERRRQRRLVNDSNGGVVDAAFGCVAL